MSMRIRTEDCTGCRLCAEVCPVDAVLSPEPGAPANDFRIVAARCTECVGHYSRPRCAALCPAVCIETDPGHLEERATLLRKWHALASGTPQEELIPTFGNGPMDMGDPDA